MEQAAVVGVPYLTAWLSLVEAGGLRKGEQLLITRASGAVGSAATQIAHWRAPLCWQPTPQKQRRIQMCF
jgi:NADPH2:quinone reductase